MIVITAKFKPKPEHVEDWPVIAQAFTEATRAEPGCLWFDWSRSLDDPTEFVLVEAFRDGDAGGIHVNSEHFKTAQRDLPPALASTPKVISESIESTGWSKLVEFAVD
jgi:quinol monooxygenase YgiN